MDLMCHPFVMKFYNSAKDENNIYFIMEHVAGERMFEIIRQMDEVDVDEARFYISQIVLVLQYFHMEHNVVYRDLKPENIMVDEQVILNLLKSFFIFLQGYVKLIDMGTAKILPSSGDKTFTIIGTPHYMAPEIIK